MIMNRSETINRSKNNNSINHHSMPSDKTAKNENKLGIFVIFMLVCALVYAAQLHG